MSAFKENDLYLLGCNHHTAPMDVRESFSLRPEHEVQMYNRLKEFDSIKETLILNTCNRVEFYCVGKKDAASHVSDLYCITREIERGLFEPHNFQLNGIDVIHHLFEVTSGLNSQMIGETEILGQVKQAYHYAKEQMSLGPVLNRVFQKSFQAAKWARTHTGIGEKQVSIGSVSADLAMRIFGELASTNALIIGAGDVAESVIHALSRRGTGQITIANRTHDTASELAHKYNGNVIYYDQIQRSLHHFDIIICCTNAPDVILDEKLIQETLELRKSGPLFLIDLSMPRNISSKADELPNTFLYNLDDLSKIANENMNHRELAVAKCREELSQKASVVWGRLDGSEDTNEDNQEAGECAAG